MVAATAPPPTAEADPGLGAVVLTHTRADEVSRTLTRLSALPGRPRIVVVDNASTDETPAVIRTRFPAARYIRLDANLGAAARNVGVELCDRPYVALCDDDTWWAPGGCSEPPTCSTPIPDSRWSPRSCSSGRARAWTR